MLNKFIDLLKGQSKESAEQIYLREQNIQFDPEQGPIVDGCVLNSLASRLEYFSNRKLENFNNLKKLFEITPQINEKIDLEIASQRFVERLDNNAENLRELKKIIQKLNAYFVQFHRNQ